MSDTRLLYCHCAYARVVPPAVKADVLAGLTNAGVAFEAVSDLCQMSARQDPRMKELAEGGPVTIAACYPRAVRGLFIQSETPLPDEGVTICNMRTDSAEDVLKAMLNGNAPAPPALEADVPEADALANVPAVPLPLVSKAALESASLAAETANGSASDRVGALTRELEQPAAGGWKPWFPVIDYTRCTNCMQCLSFCLFDVYGVKDGKIQVQNQDHCKTDCPACSRVCPEVAIMFPKYRHGPINGDVVSADDIRREAMKVDISALLGGDIYAQLRDRSAKAKSRFSKERDEDRALTERQNCLVKLKQQMNLDIPAEVLAALPSPDEIRAKAEAAAARAQEALRANAAREVEG
jgi:Pyruvate/2-oxoacid:ferredoxin oxidoreductase delta subunit